MNTKLWTELINTSRITGFSAFSGAAVEAARAVDSSGSWTLPFNFSAFFLGFGVRLPIRINANSA